MNLGLGTVQLGSAYGVSNRAGRPSAAEAQSILDYAFESGIRLIDTAAEYGESEKIVGRWLAGHASVRVVTKITAPDRATFERSLERLGQQSVYGLLLHDADALSGPDAEPMLDLLRGLKAEGRAQKIGVSFYDASQIEAVLARFVPDLAQLPVSVFDQRLLANGGLAELARRGVEIHARSVFLQGLVLMPPEEAPPHFDPVRGQLRRWSEHVRASGLTPLAAALAFAGAIPEIDALIVGVNSLAELREIVVASRAEAPVAQDWRSFGLPGERYVDPRQWNLQ